MKNLKFQRTKICRFALRAQIRRYIKDIVERKKITRVDALSDILDLLCSSVGSLTNPNNVANAINSMQKLKSRDQIAPNTVKSYMAHLEDAFLFSECKRYDVKGKNYFEYPNKYYENNFEISFSIVLNLLYIYQFLQFLS